MLDNVNFNAYGVFAVLVWVLRLPIQVLTMGIILRLLKMVHIDAHRALAYLRTDKPPPKA